MTDQCVAAFDRRWHSLGMPRGLKRRVIGAVIRGKISGMTDREAARQARDECGSVELFLFWLLVKAAITFALWWWENRRKTDADVRNRK